MREEDRSTRTYRVIYDNLLASNILVFLVGTLQIELHYRLFSSAVPASLHRSKCGANMRDALLFARFAVGENDILYGRLQAVDDT